MLTTVQKRLDEIQASLAEAHRQLGALNARPRHPADVERELLADLGRRCDEFIGRVNSRISGHLRAQGKACLDPLWNAQTAEFDDDAVSFLLRPQIERLISQRVAALTADAAAIGDEDRAAQRVALATRLAGLEREKSDLLQEIRELQRQEFS